MANGNAGKKRKHKNEPCTASVQQNDKKIKDNNQVGSVSASNSSKQIHSGTTPIDALISFAKSRSDLFLGLGGWFFAFLSLLATVIVYCINLSIYHYEVGYFHKYYGVPLMYISNPLQKGFSFFATEALILFVFISFFIIAVSYFAKTMVARLLLFSLTIIPVIIARFAFIYNNSVQYSVDAVFNLIGYCCIFCIPIFTLFALCLGIFREATISIDHPKKMSQIGMKIIISLLVAILYFSYSMVYVHIPSNIGYAYAPKNHELVIISPNEETNMQLINLGCENATYFAVLYQDEEGIVAAPCVIIENKATIYSDYHCFLKSDDLVHYVKTYDTVEVIRNNSGELKNHSQ